MVIILTHSGENVSRYNSLSPGDELNITLVLHNYGEPSRFNLKVTVDNATAPFYYNISKTSVSLGRNETSEFMVTVAASNNVTDGERVKFTVTASTPSTLEERNDFTTFVVLAISPPDDVRLCQLK